MGRISNLFRNINYLSKHSLWDQREEDILYLTNKIIDDVGYDYGLNFDNKIKVLDFDNTFELLEKTQKSFVRIGDGEIRLINGENQPFQIYEEEIADRLKSVLRVQQENLYVGINYSYYSHFPFDYERRNAYDFRCSMSKLCNHDITYIDAGVTCAKIPFAPHDVASEYVTRWKNMFKNKDIVIVCGAGVLDKLSYDVFEYANSKRFIYGLRKNSWDEHDRIMEEITSSVKKGELLVFILGMAGKAMIPDLVNIGYTCWDVGHLAKYYDAYMKNMIWDSENTKKFYMPD